jgi:hypothetical protein
MLLRDDVVGDRQAEAGAFAGRLGGEERLEQLVPDVVGNAGAVVASFARGARSPSCDHSQLSEADRFADSDSSLARLSQLDHGFGNFAPARFR